MLAEIATRRQCRARLTIAFVEDPHGEAFSETSWGQSEKPRARTELDVAPYSPGVQFDLSAAETYETANPMIVVHVAGVLEDTTVD